MWVLLDRRRNAYFVLLSRNLTLPHPSLWWWTKPYIRNIHPINLPMRLLYQLTYCWKMKRHVLMKKTYFFADIKSFNLWIRINRIWNDGISCKSSTKKYKCSLNTINFIKTFQESLKKVYRKFWESIMIAEENTIISISRKNLNRSKGSQSLVLNLLKLKTPILLKKSLDTVRC